ncbi:MAG: hypothetical protein KDC44_04210 [Phaeodactylibacter sp.]|nr:hypothetical protein [Phaeodactylibacter sp.]
MKKIGILFGQERSFPQAFVDRVNSKGVDGIHAELAQIEQAVQNRNSGYAVLVDRISQDVPFYRAYLKNAAATGTAVINNPFWWSADEKFFNNVLAEQIGVPVPKTVLLPSKDHPVDTTADSFTNLKFPLEWDAIFDYIGGFPAFMKPYAGGGWKNVYKLHNPDEFFQAYNETGQLVMMLQEAIEFDAYFRCYCIGRKYVRVMHYEPRNPHHLRYAAHHDISDELMGIVEGYVLDLNKALGYDFNTVEFAIRDGVPYAIDFCNPAPDADLHSVGAENFEWVVEHMAQYAIERAQAQDPEKDNLAWGWFMQNAWNDNFAGKQAAAPAPAAKAPAKKAPAKKAPAKKAPAKKEGSLLDRIGSATAKEADDLKLIKGVGPKLEKTLNELGIYTYAQVSKMGKTEYKMLDDLLTAFKGRAERDDWAKQAKKLAK